MTLWYHLVASLPFGWAQFTFMQHALLAVVIFAPLLAVLGCMIVNNQMAFFSDAIGHSALTGIAIGALAGLANPLWPMLIFAVALALCITLLRRYSSGSGDTVIGIVMSTAVALGIVILSRGGGFSRYSRFLIGDLLSVTPGDILYLLIVAVLFGILWATTFNKLFLVSVHPSLARSRGVGVWRTQILFAIVTALVVTVSIQWVGILVINALIILPAAASRNVARSAASYQWIALAASLAAGIAGLVTSYYMSTATGATIVLMASVLYGVSLVIRVARGLR